MCVCVCVCVCVVEQRSCFGFFPFKPVRNSRGKTALCYLAEEGHVLSLPETAVRSTPEPRYEKSADRENMSYTGGHDGCPRYEKSGDRKNMAYTCGHGG